MPTMFDRIGDRVRRAVGLKTLDEMYPEPFAPPAPDRIADQQRGEAMGRARELDVALYGGNQRMFESVTGAADPGTRTLREQRERYRGLIYRMADIRANAWLEAVNGLVIRREIDVDQYEDVEADHGWRSLMRRLNPHYSNRMLWRWVQLNKDLGNRGAVFFIEYDEGTMIPKYLHPVTAVHGSVRPVPNAMGTGIGGFKFLRRGDSTPVDVPVYMVVWLRHVAPWALWESASVIEAAAYESDVSYYMQVYRRDLLEHGGLPPVYVKSPEPVDDREAIRLGRRLMKMYGGYKAASTQLPVLGDNAEFATVGVQSKDLEYVAGADLNAKELMDIWGIPQGMIRDTANRANADAARDTFAQSTAQPLADDNCDQFTDALRRAFSAFHPDAEDDLQRLSIAAPSLVPMDADLEMRRRASYLSTGQRTVDFYRRQDGLEPFGGDAARPMTGLSLQPMQIEFDEDGNPVNDAPAGDE